MNVKMKVRTLMFLIGILILFLFDIFFDYSKDINVLISGAVLILSILLVYRARKNIPLLLSVIFIAYSNYSICSTVYFFNNGPESLYRQFTDVNVYGTAILCICVFLVYLNLFIDKKCFNQPFYNYNDLYKKNNFIYVIIIILLVIIFFFGYTNSGNVRSSSSPLYEYSAILFIFVIYFSNKNKNKITIVFCLIVAYSMQSFLGGNRVEAIIFIYVYLIMVLSNKLNSKMIFVGMAFFIFVLTSIGHFRQNFILSFDGVLEILSKLWDSKLSLDTAVYAYIPSLCSIDFKSNFNTVEKLYYFNQHILYMFFGSSVPDSSLVTLTREYYLHSNGYVTPTYFYFWFGIFGAIIPSFLITKYLTIRKNTKFKEFRVLLSVYILSTVSRWYLYGPIALFRGVFIFTVVYVGVKILEKMTTK